METKKEKKKLIDFFNKKQKKDKIDEVIEIFERVLDKYNEKVMLKAVLSNEGKSIEIYSTNFKTTLNKPKKPKIEENETEERETTTK